MAHLTAVSSQHALPAAPPASCQAALRFACPGFGHSLLQGAARGKCGQHRPPAAQHPHAAVSPEERTQLLPVKLDAADGWAFWRFDLEFRLTPFQRSVQVGAREVWAAPAGSSSVNPPRSPCIPWGCTVMSLLPPRPWPTCAPSPSPPVARAAAVPSGGGRQQRTHLHLLAARHRPAHALWVLLLQRLLLQCQAYCPRAPGPDIPVSVPDRGRASRGARFRGRTRRGCQPTPDGGQHGMGRLCCQHTRGSAAGAPHRCSCLRQPAGLGRACGRQWASRVGLEDRRPWHASCTLLAQLTWLAAGHSCCVSPALSWRPPLIPDPEQVARPAFRAQRLPDACTGRRR